MVQDMLTGDSMRNARRDADAYRPRKVISHLWHGTRSLRIEQHSADLIERARRRPGARGFHYFAQGRRTDAANDFQGVDFLLRISNHMRIVTQEEQLSLLFMPHRKFIGQMDLTNLFSILRVIKIDIAFIVAGCQN